MAVYVGWSFYGRQRTVAMQVGLPAQPLWLSIGRVTEKYAPLVDSRRNPCGCSPGNGVGMGAKRK